MQSSERVLQATCNAHFAPDDVEALGSLLKTCKITDNMAHIFTVTAIHNSVCLVMRSLKGTEH